MHLGVAVSCKTSSHITALGVIQIRFGAYEMAVACDFNSEYRVYFED